MISKIKKKLSDGAEAGLTTINSSLAALSKRRRIRAQMRDEDKYLDSLMLYFDSAKIALKTASDKHEEPEVITNDKGEWLSPLIYGPMPLSPKRVFQPPKNMFKRLEHDYNRLTPEQCLELYDYYKNMSRAMLDLHRIIDNWNQEYLSQIGGDPDLVSKIFSTISEYFDTIGYHNWFTGHLMNDAAATMLLNEQLVEEIKPALHGWAAQQHVERDVEQLADDMLWLYDHLYKGGDQQHPDFRFRLGRAMAKLDVVNKEVRARDLVHADIAISKFRAGQAYDRFVAKGEKPENPKSKSPDRQASDLRQLMLKLCSNFNTFSEVFAQLIPRSAQWQVINWQNRAGKRAHQILEYQIDAHDKVSPGRVYAPMQELKNLLADKMLQRCQRVHKLIDEPAVDGERNQVDELRARMSASRCLVRRTKWKPDLQSSEPMPWFATSVISAGLYDRDLEQIVPIDDMTPLEIFKSEKRVILTVKAQPPLRIGDLMWAIATMELMSPGLNLRHATAVKRVLEEIHPGEYSRLIAAHEHRVVKNLVSGINRPSLHKIFRLSDDQ